MSQEHNRAKLLAVRGNRGQLVHFQTVIDEGILFVVLEDVNLLKMGPPTIGAPVLSWAGGAVAHHRVYGGPNDTIGFEPWDGPWPCPWNKEEELRCVLAAGRVLGVVQVIPMGIGGEA